MLIDTHAHLNFKAYQNDADKVIQRSLADNVQMINVGSQYDTSKRAVAIAKDHKEGIYASIGLHPIHAQDGFDCQKYKELAKSEKVVAIGEIGLDYKSEYLSFRAEQKQVFLKQIELAQELGLPVIFHCRFAHADLLKILENQSRHKGVVHCFTGNWPEAESYLAKGLFLGFNGIIFKLNLDEIIKKTPLDKILIETDCPYLTPPQVEGRNEPLYVKYVAEKIAEIKKKSYREVAEITADNAKKLFGLE